jgi:protein O-mannosyl-transferase
MSTPKPNTNKSKSNKANNTIPQPSINQVAKPTIDATVTYKWWPLLVVLITAICHFVGINNQFVNWDDEAYIKFNELIKTLDMDSVIKMFSLKSIYGGNYHPLVALTNAIEYNIVGMEPKLYHIVNLLFHLANTYLVYIFIRLLSKQNNIVAASVALLFGIHPMHVESVAWISERKDVLYSFFYLLALVQYMQFKIKQHSNHIIFALVFYILSLLCKSMAVTLPLILITIDLYWNYTNREKWQAKSLVNKIPFFALSIVFGLITISTQTQQNYIGAYNFSIIDKVFISSYGIIFYIVKLLAPMHLSTLIPFPKQGIPITYYAAFGVLVALAIAVWRSKQYRSLLLFGLAFYVLSISVVLQFITVGSAVVCERYTYMSYIGLFFVIATMLHQWYVQKPAMQGAIKAVSIIAFIALGIGTYLRTQVWYDGESLWRDTTEKYPETADYAWYGLGNILKEKKGDPKEVLAAYNKAISINNTFPNYLLNSSSAKGEYGDIKGALTELDRAIKLDPNFAMAYYNRGILKNDKFNDFNGAISDYTNALRVNPNYVQAQFNRAISYKALSKFGEAIADYNVVISKDANFINAYVNCGNIYFNNKQYPEAINYYNRALAKSPTDANALTSRAASHLYMGNNTQACADFAAAAAAGSEQAKQALANVCK